MDTVQQLLCTLESHSRYSWYKFSRNFYNSCTVVILVSLSWRSSRWRVPPTFDQEDAFSATHGGSATCGGTK